MTRRERCGIAVHLTGVIERCGCGSHVGEHISRWADETEPIRIEEARQRSGPKG